jgi:hypothetical protein
LARKCRDKVKNIKLVGFIPPNVTVICPCSLIGLEHTITTREVGSSNLS